MRNWFEVSKLTTNFFDLFKISGMTFKFLIVWSKQNNYSVLRLVQSQWNDY